MKVARLFQVLVIGLVICGAIPAAIAVGRSNSDLLINRIEGVVWDPYRRPVADLYVELQNENYSSISRTRTDSTGRFSFTGVSGGHYNLKVLTNGTNYLEYTEGFDVVNVVRGSSDSVQLDVYLKFDKRKYNSGAANITEAVFVQDVPEEARKLYKKGIKDINANNTCGGIHTKQRNKEKETKI